MASLLFYEREASFSSKLTAGVSYHGCLVRVHVDDDHSCGKDWLPLWFLAAVAVVVVARFVDCQTQSCESLTDQDLYDGCACCDGKTSRDTHFLALWCCSSLTLPDWACALSDWDECEFPVFAFPR